MLKQAVEYTDFDGDKQTETLYFNITKIELADNLDLQDELKKIEREFKGEFTRELETHEIRRVLELVKRIMKMAYGVRSDDGKRFIKNDQQWEEFTQTALYDNFLYGLFVKPDAAVAWMTAVLPADLRDAALEASNHTNGMSAERTAEVMAAQAEQSRRAEAASNARVQQATDLVVDTVKEISEPGSVKTEANGRPILSENPTEDEAEALMKWVKNN